jgi:hypothetical protein
MSFAENVQMMAQLGATILCAADQQVWPADFQTLAHIDFMTDVCRGWMATRKP